MILGINSQNHDASMALIDGDKILWAGHAERYSRVKNDCLLNNKIMDEMLQYGQPKEIVWIEQPLLKATRRIRSGERPIFVNPHKEVEKFECLDMLDVQYVKHHYSHACAGYYTSKFKDAAILVVDAIGEWNTVTIWHAQHTYIRKMFTVNYPHSIGLFYSAITQYCGLKPNEEEYILMGMSAIGEPKLVDDMKEDFFSYFDPPFFTLKHNLHKGCCWWPAIKNGATKFDIAASAQKIVEEYLVRTAQWAKTKIPSENLVFMGGVALNCVANTLIAHHSGYKNVHIMPNPGDAGSAIGAVAAFKNQKLDWQGPFLGTDIAGEPDIKSMVKDLKEGRVIALAKGRAEFGPRALGNRSLLCDPRGPDAQDRMNKIKKREAFRPFAPAILAEHAKEYFDMPVDSSPYMQFVARCLKPDELPGICHVDGTSRVQTVTEQDNPHFRALLEAWYKETGCPVLMNTSLNIKGEPLVNDADDVLRFQERHNIKVY